jgi:hypothetical protein
MKGLISFSLFGDDPKYFNGLIKNIDLSQEIYPTCDIVVYATDTHTQTLKQIGTPEHVKIISMGESLDLSGMFWRFKALEIPNYGYYIFRDVDSRLSRRESVMVEEWLASEKNLHVIRDHPMHNAPVLGGMWGIRCDYKNVILKSLEINVAEGYYGEDQEFLWEYVYKPYRRDLVVHDRYFLREASSVKRGKRPPDHSYIGESFDDLERYSQRLRDIMVISENSLYIRTRLRLLSIILKMRGR